MRNRTLLWWLAPGGVLLVLAGLFAGIWLAKRQDVGAQAGLDRGVEAPGKSATEEKPVANTPQTGTSQPAPGEQPADSAPKPPAPEEPKRPNDTEATAFMQRFMAARMNADAAQMHALLAPSLASEGIRLSKPDARITGFSLELLGSGDPETFFFRARVGFQTGHPGGEVAVEDFKLTWKEGFKVAYFEEQPKESLALSVGTDKKLYLSRGQDTAVAAELGTLPPEASPFAAPDNTRFGVGKDGWSIAVPSYTGGHVLWVTRGLHPLVGISEVNWGGAPDQQPLDLLFEAGVTDAAWAPGGAKHAALAVAEPSGAVTLHVWDLTTKQRYGPDLHKVTGVPDFMVKNLRWVSPQVVVFDMVKGGIPPVPWSYNVVTKNLTHP